MTEYQTAEEAARAAGVPVEEPIYEDYFGFDATKKWLFPDGRQWIEFKIMNEGDRSKFQKLTSQDIRVKRSTGDASIKADPAEERRALLTSSVKNWNVFRRNPSTAKFEQVPFSIGSPGANFEQWLDHADPKLVDDLEFTIRMANPWLQDAMTVEQIDKEMDRLVELRKNVEERELEKARSGSR